MAKCTMEIQVKISWWFRYLYIPGLKIINWLTVNFIDIDAKPDAEKIKRTAIKAIKLYSNGKRI